MAIWKTRTELKNFELSNGKTVNLIDLIGTLENGGSWVDDLVAPTAAPEIGTVAYVDAMGNMRRGVVVKTTRTKVHVALTTQGAVDAAMRQSYGQPIRVQIVIADTNYVRVAPPAKPLDATSELAQSLVEADHAEALAEADERRWSHGSIIDAHDEALTLNSQDGKVDNMDNDANAKTADLLAEPEMDAEGAGELIGLLAEEGRQTEREVTGSAVVKLMERIHDRIRQNHPEVPAVVIVTGAGTSLGSAKWGHFRPQGWTTGDKKNIHEMFMAGETLAKGSRQVLQTMLHESAHALCEQRGQQDTSRQGRWHNKVFLAAAEEMGLEYRHSTADKAIGYSQVVLTEETVRKYANLLAKLDKEIHLMVRLPGWLGGDAGEDGGESMGKAPKTGGEASNGGNLKLTCLCEEPNIIRASKKVAEKMVVRCGDCEEFFAER